MESRIDCGTWKTPEIAIPGAVAGSLRVAKLRSRGSQ